MTEWSATMSSDNSDESRTDWPIVLRLDSILHPQRQTAELPFEAITKQQHESTVSTKSSTESHGKPTNVVEDEDTVSSENTDDLRNTRLEGTISTKNDDCCRLQQTEALRDGMQSDQGLRVQSPGLTTFSEEDTQSDGSQSPTNRATPRVEFVPPVDYHAEEILSQAQLGNWLVVARHFRKAPEIPTDEESLLPTPRSEVFSNLNRISQREILYRSARKQVEELWTSSTSLQDAHIPHSFPCRMSDAFRRMIVKEAGRQADIVEVLHLACYCSDEERDVIASEAVKRGIWRLVCLLIAGGFASNSLHQWAIEEAIRNADPLEYNAFIYPCCTSDTDNDSVIKLLVEKGQYISVDIMLQSKLCHEECHVQALKDASRLATEKDLKWLIHKDNVKGHTLDCVLTEVATRGMWLVVVQMLRENCVSDSQTRMKVIQLALAKANMHDLHKIMDACTLEELDCLLLGMMEQDTWYSVRNLLMHAQFFVDGTENDDFDDLHWRLYTDVSVWPRLLQRFDCSVIMSLLAEAIQQNLCDPLEYLFTREWYYASKLNILSTLSFHETARETLQSYPMLCAPFFHLSSVLDEMFTAFKIMYVPDDQSERWQDFVTCLHRWTSVVLAAHAQVDPHLFTAWQSLLLQNLFERVARVKACFFKYEHLRIVLGIVPAIPLVQNAAVRFLASTERWIYVHHVCWYFVQEEVRRRIFREAVKQRQWKVVNEWSLHTLYEDERAWAIGQAMRDSQWQVVISLVRHGLDQVEVHSVQRQVALHADWEVVEEMVEQGTDVVPILEDLQEIARTRLSKVPERQLTSRLDQLRELKDRLVRNSLDFDLALWRCDWPAVLYKVRHTKSTARDIEQAVTTALQVGAWHVVEQLVKCGSSAAGGVGSDGGGGSGGKRRTRRKERQLQEQRDGLFQMALEGQQWSLVRTLLERGVSFHVSFSALPFLLEAHEWLLVARVMEDPELADSCRQQILYHALEHGEGSLGVHCITCLHHPLTHPERQQVFELALKEGLCQLVNHLLQEQDSLAQAQRDTALVAAVRRRQWSIIDRCFEQGAEVDPEQGNTLAHLCAQYGRWWEVEKLVHHGADPHIPDSEGCTLLSRAMLRSSILPFAEDQYQKMLLEFHCDISYVSVFHSDSPHYNLIRNEGVDHVDTALLWGHDLTRDVRHEGDTVLHLVCKKGRWDTMRLLVARGCNPLVKTNSGKTILCAATEDPQLAHKMVAECLKLGVGTFQPEITDSYSKKKKLTLLERTPFRVQTIEAASPFQRAAALGDMELMNVLYKAGACSSAELCRFSAVLKARKVSTKSRGWQKAEELSSYVEHLATTPRTLLSCCRLVISHHLGVQWKRERRAAHLDQLDKFMKNYVLFQT